MGRAEAKAQLNETNAVARQRNAQAQEMRGGLLQDYQSMMNEGYTPQQKAAMTTSGMEASAAPFDTAALQGENEAARTRNTAGTAALQSQLARDKGKALGTEAQMLEGGFANQEQANRQAGVQGKMGMYGLDTGAMESMYGLGPGTLDVMNKPPWWSPLAVAAIGAGGKVIRGGATGGGG
jgi:hypothetical protein